MCCSVRVIAKAVVGSSVHLVGGYNQPFQVFPFKDKLEESLKDIENIFKSNKEDGVEGKENQGENENKYFNNFDTNNPFPNAEELNEHMNTIMGGKLGCLAKEIADSSNKEHVAAPIPGLLVDLAVTEGLKVSKGAKFP